MLLRDLGRFAGLLALAGILATWPGGAGAEGPRVPFAEDASMVAPTSGNSRPAPESDEAFLRGRVWANGIHPDWSFADARVAPGTPPSNGKHSRKPQIADLHLHPDYWVAVSPPALTSPHATVTTDPGAPASSGS